MPYQQAWDLQREVHAEVADGKEPALLLVEHPPVVTLGRRPDAQQHLLASPEFLAARGVELVASDRGGDVTFHGPGQLVAYPIVRLIDCRLSVGGYVHRLEDAIIDTLAKWNIAGTTDPDAVGVWTPLPDRPQTQGKIAAIGVRVRRGVTMHGLALNVTTDLSYFQLIVPCGLMQRPVTSMQMILRDATPSMDKVKRQMAQSLQKVLGV